MHRPRSLVVASLVLALGPLSLHAGDLRIPLPKRSKYTPVQKLNRDGVSAVEKHQYDKAKKLFYEAYLIDPNDPFTLNNLGYMAELEGDTDRAQRYYQLSSEVSSDAVVDKANNSLVEGKPVSAVAGNAEEKGIKINRLNSQAIALLNKDRAPEADLILQKALALDAKNPFTLNNMGYAKEKEGELEAAYQYYSAAANSNSGERIEIAAYPNWRGRAISQVARDNANKLSRNMRDGSMEARVARLNLRGVSAMNRNDRRAARQYIEQAYKLAPTDAFTLNNMGYLAELDGDRETANHFYERAQEANKANSRVALATRKEVEGMRIGEVALNSDALVSQRMAEAQAERQRMGGPVLLRRRADNSVVVEPAEPVARPQVRVSDANGNLILPPRPATSSSPSTGGLAMPLPDSQQPVTVHQGENDNGLIMPLPENDQPGPNGNVKEGPKDGGMIMPLPDNQQPGAQQPAGQQPGDQRQDSNAIGNPVNTQPPATTVPNPPATQPSTAPPQRPVAPQQNVPQQSAPVQPSAPNQTAPAPTQQNPGLLLPAPDQTQAPPAQQTAPTQQQTPQRQQEPGLLLPPPDNQQQPNNQAAPPKNNTAQNGNIGVYTPPAPNRTTSQPKRINDNNRPAANSNVHKIDDRK
ncbi:MAG TPA: hypothetical protein VN577_15410 [Terriglobales bacterium]|nr:hypothetical protein [Terriglobales bacterium]